MSLSKEKIAALRRDYRSHQLDLSQVNEDPILQFQQWFEAALEAEVPEPNAMTLATVGPNHRPSARTVLVKGFDQKGFVFYTNYESQKGKELLANPFAALVFCWLELERQVRIEGKVEKISRADSLQYFTSRPKGSQIGAWASPQSEVIAGRGVMEELQKELEEKYAAAENLPLPPHWGGYVVIPDKIEFWQGRSSRLHDRLRYTLEGGEWRIDRLAP